MKKGLILLLGVIILTGCSIKNQTTQLVKIFTPSIKCSSFNQEKCLYYEDECMGIPKISYVDGMPNPTSFGGCQEISKDRLVGIESAKAICIKTNGLWTSDLYTRPGYCFCKSGLYADGGGCSTRIEKNKISCQKTGGTWDGGNESCNCGLNKKFGINIGCFKINK